MTENKEKIRVGFATKIANAINFKKLRLANITLKTISCFVLLTLSLVLLGFVADTWKFLNDSKSMYTKNGDVNPEFKWLLSSTIILVVSALVEMWFIFKLFTNKNISIYKFMIIPFIITVIGFFTTFEPFTQIRGQAINQNFSHLPEGTKNRWANLSLNMLITMTSTGLLYLSIITTTISIDSFTKKNFIK